MWEAVDNPRLARAGESTHGGRNTGHLWSILRSWFFTAHSLNNLLVFPYPVTNGKGTLITTQVFESLLVTSTSHCWVSCPLSMYDGIVGNLGPFTPRRSNSWIWIQDGGGTSGHTGNTNGYCLGPYIWLSGRAHA